MGGLDLVKILSRHRSRYCALPKFGHHRCTSPLRRINLHFVDIFVTRSTTFIPLYVFGFSEITFNTYIIFMAIHAVLIHANTRINFGFLKYIIATPQYHHWHHCLEPEYYEKKFRHHFSLH